MSVAERRTHIPTPFPILMLAALAPGTVEHQNVKKHLDACKFTVVACKYQRLGCNMKMIWNNMNVATLDTIITMEEEMKMNVLRDKKPFMFLLRFAELNK